MWVWYNGYYFWLPPRRCRFNPDYSLQLKKGDSMKKIEIKFSIGDSINSEKYGKGIIKNINPEDGMFTYFAYFEDGTRAWFNGKGVEKI